MYHAATKKIEEITWSDVCLTSDEGAAASYIEEGWMHEVEFVGCLADEDDLMDAADEVGVTSDWAFDLADDERVRSILKDWGYDGVRYEDCAPGGGEHDCVRVWNAPCLTIVDSHQM